jgi:hypothetical protein
MTTWTLASHRPQHTVTIIGTSADETAARRGVIDAAATLLQQRGIGPIRYELAIDGDIIAIIQTGDGDDEPAELRELLHHIRGADPFT